MTKKQSLLDAIQLFIEGDNKDHRYFMLYMKIDGYPDHEMIINTRANMKEKIEYIKGAYDTQLRLNNKVIIDRWSLVL